MLLEISNKLSFLEITFDFILFYPQTKCKQEKLKINIYTCMF